MRLRTVGSVMRRAYDLRFVRAGGTGSDEQVTPRDVVILGSTGSIGTQALDLVRANPDRFRVVGADRRRLQPGAVRAAGRRVRARPSRAWARRRRVEAAAARRATSCSTASPAPSGCGPTLAALDAGNTLALANKESLIIGGPLVTGRAKPGQIVPVDSEHSALAQCLRGGSREEVRRLVLTASGGPFRGRTRDELADVTRRAGAGAPDLGHGPDGHDQLRHPGQQGPRGDRGAPALRHPVRPDRGRGAPDQSVVHSMVEFVDGSTLVQASPPTMLIPIALGLAWPDRVPDAAPPVDWTTPETWEFFPLDDEAFPAVALARAAGELRRHRARRLQRRQRGVRRRASAPGGCGSPTSSPRSPPSSGEHDVPSKEELTVDDVLAADAWARARATDHRRRDRMTAAATTPSGW